MRISSVLPDASDVAKAHADEGEQYNLRVSFASLTGELASSCNTGKFLMLGSIDLVVNPGCPPYTPPHD